MLLTDHIVEDSGGAIACELTHADAAVTACTVAIYDDIGTAVLAATSATVPPLATTSTVPLERGERQVDVTALSSGDLQAGDAVKVRQTDGREQVFTCQELDVTRKRVYFAEESLIDCSAGAAVFGLVARYTVASTVPTKTWWRGRAVWTPTWSSAAQDPTAIPLHAVKYRIPQKVATAADLHRLFGALARVQPMDASLEAQLADARVRALDDLITDGIPAHALIPWERFKVLQSLAWMLAKRWQAIQGIDWNALEASYAAERERILLHCSRDTDQDGVATDSETASGRCYSFERA